MGADKKITNLETEYEHKLQSQKNEYDLIIEEMKVDQAVLEVDGECKSRLIEGLCGALSGAEDPELRKLAERVSFYCDIQFGTGMESEERVNVLELMDGLVKEKRAEADAAGVTLRGTVKSIRDTKAKMNLQYVGLLLKVLIEEALLATDEGDSVLVIADQTEAPEGELAYTFSVKDSGKQAVPESLVQYLRPFGTVRGRESIGAGVNPAIAERLAYLLHTELSVNTSPEGGLTVSFTVSAKKE